MGVWTRFIRASIKSSIYQQDRKDTVREWAVHMIPQVTDRFVSSGISDSSVTLPGRQELPLHSPCAVEFVVSPWGGGELVVSHASTGSPLLQRFLFLDPEDE